MNTLLPHGWKALTLDRYDGTTDPDNHLDDYVTQLKTVTIDDAILFKVFATYLKRATLNWYTRLPPASIYSFEALVVRFSAQFATRRAHHMTSTALVGLKQEKNGSLRSFMDRFAVFSAKI